MPGTGTCWPAGVPAVDRVRDDFVADRNRAERTRRGAPDRGHDSRRLATDIAGNNGPAVRELLASYRRIHRMTVGEGEVAEAIVSRGIEAARVEIEGLARVEGGQCAGCRTV